MGEGMKLPEDVKKRLAEIFTEPYLPAVKKACERYLRESQEQKPSIPEDGRTLLLISEKAQELCALLNGSKTALKRMQRNFPGWPPRLSAIKKELGALSVVCEHTPETEQTKPKRGRPAGAVDGPERRLAFMLWEIYRQAHGKTAGRSVVSFESGARKSGEEVGPLPCAADILGPVLNLKSNLARHFRSIEQMHRGAMDKK